MARTGHRRLGREAVMGGGWRVLIGLIGLIAEGTWSACTPFPAISAFTPYQTYQTYQTYQIL